jgi:hypothetical protein
MLIYLFNAHVVLGYLCKILYCYKVTLKLDVNILSPVEQYFDGERAFEDPWIQLM